MLWEILEALRESIFLILSSTLIVTLIGFILGLTLLFKEKQLRLLHYLLHFAADLPVVFIIFFTFCLVKIIFPNQSPIMLILTSIVLSAFIKHSLEIYHLFKTIPKAIYEVTLNIGAPNLKLIKHVILPETANGIVLITINLLKHAFGYSLACEALTGTGLGGLLISKCMYDASFSYLAIIVLSALTLFALIQLAGNYIIYGELRVLSR